MNEYTFIKAWEKKRDREEGGLCVCVYVNRKGLIIVFVYMYALYTLYIYIIAFSSFSHFHIFSFS